MFSELFEERSALGVFFDLLILCILYIAVYRCYTIHYQSKRTRHFEYFLILLFCIFSFWGGDWFHYREIVLRFGIFHVDLSAIRLDSNLELPYFFIINLIGTQYILFRIIVWGGALLLVLLTSKRLKLNSNTLCISFSAFGLLLFSYGRVSLAMAIGFLGFSFFIQPLKKKKILSYIIGAAIVALSIFYHKTALFLVFVVLLSLFPLGKKSLVFIIPSFFLGIYLFNEIGITYLLTGDEEDSVVNFRAAQKYMVSTGGGKGIFSTVAEILRYSIFYLSALYSIILLQKQIIPSPINYLAKATIWIVLTSSIFLFSNGVNTYTMFYRCLNYCLIPISLLYSYLFCNRRYNFPRFMLFLGMFSSIYSILISFVYLLSI